MSFGDLFVELQNLQREKGIKKLWKKPMKRPNVL